MNTLNEGTLIDQTTRALREHGLVVEVQKAPETTKNSEADIWLRVGKNKHRTDYVIQVIRKVTPSTMGAVVAQLKQVKKAAKRPPLLVTDYLTPPVAKQLQTHGQQFVDAAGNTYLNGDGLFVYVIGHKLQEKQTAPRADKIFATAGLKILFALICEPALADATHRTIAASAGVALGTVPTVLADLRKVGYLLVANKRRRLNASKRLLDEWALGYARTLRGKTLSRRFVAKGFDNWPNWQLDLEKARWGGEPAANLLVHYLRPGVLTIYAETLPPKLMLEQRLIPANILATEHLVEVRKPFWGRALGGETRPDTVPPALVYADLLATGDGRCIETAEMVYDHYLARLLPAA